MDETFKGIRGESLMKELFTDMWDRVNYKKGSFIWFNLIEPKLV